MVLKCSTGLLTVIALIKGKCFLYNVFALSTVFHAFFMTFKIFLQDGLIHSFLDKLLDTL